MTLPGSAAPRSRTLFALLAFLAFAPCAAVPDSRPAVLRIGTSGDYAPFSETLAAAQGYRGFDIAVAEAFARDSAYAIEWVQFHWSTLAADMRAGRFDLVMSGITIRPDRSALGRFSVPVMNSGAVLLYSHAAFPAVADAASRTDELSTSLAGALGRFDRPGITIAVNRGGHLERVTRQHFSRATIVTIADNAAVRQALISAGANAIVTDTLEAPHWRSGLSEVGAFGPWTTDRKAYWVAPDREELARQLDAWLLAREEDGTLARLRESSTGVAEHERTAEPLNALLAAIEERLALMPWVADSKRRAGIEIEDRAQEARVLEASWRGVQLAARRAAADVPDEAAVKAFYRAQITAAKRVQRQAPNPEAGARAEAGDLRSILRPALVRIGERMATLIVALRQRAPSAYVEAEVRSALHPFRLGPESLAQIAEAIAALAAQAE